MNQMNPSELAGLAPEMWTAYVWQQATALAEKSIRDGTLKGRIPEDVPVLAASIVSEWKKLGYV